jgi:hypothetical protein
VSNYATWAWRHPQAAAELQALLGAVSVPTGAPSDGAHQAGQSEAWAQQQVRLKVSHAGAMSWRNNVGATPARCPDCGAQQRPIRYGLCNDSPQLNKRFKSSDLILAIPRRITPAMVGTTIAQFGSIETKRPGWAYKGTDREVGQLAWITLIEKLGGYARFSTGGIEL